MSSEMPELLPCPFCGGSNLKAGGDDKFVGVRCLDCEAVGPNQYITGAHWSHRRERAQIRREVFWDLYAMATTDGAPGHVTHQQLREWLAEQEAKEVSGDE